ncbi:MAG: hypothetical protein CMM58_05245 [Rhodospirillaceae bacterium]|nr:hypothetical protein [Rhodospirillaceae bacterium]|tara:strand:- start:4 stop:2133 length:2130 start_codon:yes stop_codon:yes gene_type:complete
MPDISKFFRPGSIAFVGATSDESKLGGRRFRSLVEGGYTGTIYAVNPSAKSIRGIPAYSNLLEVPGTVDLAVIVVPANAVLPTIDDCVRLEIPAVMLISAGFGEVNRQGKEAEVSLVNKVRSAGGRVIGPNCAGLFSHAAGINLGGATVPAGSIALISQSGNLLLDFNLRAIEVGLGFSRQVAIGNAADLDGVDLVADCLDDPNTSVILAYMEGWEEGRGRALFELARDHPEKKPIVLLKPGRSVEGKLAAITHTGSLSGEDRVIDSALHQAGILRASGIREAWAMTEALCRCPPVLGDSVAIVSDGGGHATVLADSLGLKDFKIPKFSRELQKSLSHFLPSRATITNPVDFAGVVESEPAVLPKAIDVCFKMGSLDAILVAGHFGGYHLIGGSELEGQEIEAAHHITNIKKKHKVPVLFQSIHADNPTKSLEILRRGGIPVFRDPENIAAALEALKFFPNLPDRSVPLSSAKVLSDQDKKRAIRICKSGGNKGILLEPEARKLLELANFDIPEFVMAKSADDGFEKYKEKRWTSIAAKLIAPDIIHRQRVGGIHLNVNGETSVRASIETLLKRFPAASRSKAKILLTPMIEPGRELICSGFRDRQFGPVVMLGIGGTMVEVVENVVFRLPPFSKDEPLSMIKELGLSSVLDNSNRQSSICINIVADILVKIGALLVELPILETIELNPVIVSSDCPRIADVSITYKKL